MPETLYLIDGHALAYRTYFALTGGGGAGRWVTSKGEPTAGIFGFTSVLLRLLEEERPDYLAVAFDVGKTFRDAMYSEYKATREKMPDDLRAQLERMRQLVDTFNIPRLELDGYEADDVLGSVAKAAAAEGLGVKIITGDRDLLQLVTERIIVSLPGRRLSDSTDYTPKLVAESLGVRPDQVIDYKALMGDSSDNISGIKGIGNKTAVKILTECDFDWSRVLQHKKVADYSNFAESNLELTKSVFVSSVFTMKRWASTGTARDFTSSGITKFLPSMAAFAWEAR